MQPTFEPIFQRSMTVMTVDSCHLRDYLMALLTPFQSIYIYNIYLYLMNIIYKISPNIFVLMNKPANFYS